MYELERREVEFKFVPEEFYSTFKASVKSWYDGFCYSFPNRIPEARLVSLEHPIGFEFESSLIWFAGAIIETLDPNGDLEYATAYELSVMERILFEEDIRTLLDAENMVYLLDGKVQNAIILEVW
jgi:hypothetical protein